MRACDEVQGTFALTIEGRGFESKVSAGISEDFLDSECVSCGACVQACPTATLMEKSIVEHGQPDHKVITTCAYCGVGCSFQAEMKGDQVVRMTPTRTARRTTATAASKAALPGVMPRIAIASLKPMIREQHQRPVARSELGRGDQYTAPALQGNPGQIRPQVDRRHHLVALHQRRSLRGAEARTRRIPATTTSTPAPASVTRRPVTA